MAFLFIIISINCFLIAAFFLWLGNLDVAFVVGTLGIVAWFLNIRFKLKAAIRENEKKESEDFEEDES
jgi:uncharacterized membrane protein